MLHMPIYTMDLDESKYEIVKNDNRKPDFRTQTNMVEETLRVKNAHLNESGAFVCITGHMAAVRYNVFYVDVVDQSPILTTESISTYHFAAIMFVFGLLVIIVIVGFWVGLRKMTKTTVSDYAKATSGGKKASSEKANHCTESKQELLADKEKSPPPVVSSTTEVGPVASVKTTSEAGKKLVFLQGNIIYSDTFNVEHVVDKGKI
jgi:hypothetical protein